MGTVNITKAPTVKPATGKPTYKDAKFTVKWTFAGHTDDSDDKAEEFRVHWRAKYKNMKFPSKSWTKARDYDHARIGESGEDSYSINRYIYRPAFKSRGVQYKGYISALYVGVTASNGKGIGPWGDSPEYTFKKPDKSKISNVSFNQTNRRWEAKITPAASKPPKERLYTFHNAFYRYSWGTKAQRTKWTSYTAQGTYNKKGGYIPRGDNDAYSIGYNLPSSFDGIGFSDWYLVKIVSYSAGMGGNSASAVRYRAFGYPRAAIISSFSFNRDSHWKWDSRKRKYVTTKGDVRNGDVLVKIAKVGDVKKVSGVDVHPIDSMELQVLRNTEITSAVEAAASNAWQTVDTGNSGTTFLMDSMADSMPDVGKHVWYRVVTKHDHLSRYSDPKRCTGLEWKLGKGGVLEVYPVVEAERGTGLKVIYGFNADNMDGTEIVWSTHRNSWFSNESMSSGRRSSGVYSTDQTKAYNKQHNTSWQYTSCFYITGLEEGAKYYVGMRRYVSGSSGEELGSTSWYTEDGKIKPVLFASKPTNVKLSAPSYYLDVANPTVEVSWNFDAYLKQKSFTLYYRKWKRDGNGDIVYTEADESTDPQHTDPEGYKLDNKGQRIPVTEWKALYTPATDTATMYYALTSSQIKTAVQDENKLVLRVGVTVGGPSVNSNTMTIVPVTKPSMLLAVDSEMRDNGNNVCHGRKPTFHYNVSRSALRVLVSVVSDGMAYMDPDGDRLQMSGDVIYTGVISNPVPGDDPAVASLDFVLPECEIIDGCNYTISMTPYDAAYKLRGDTVTLPFHADFSHKAAPPSNSSLVLGDHLTQTAVIKPLAPDNAVETDRCDIYRVTPDGATLIVPDATFGAWYRDPFAPFSNTVPLRYRLVTKTIDGSKAWSDIPYNVNGYCIRFDWFTESGRQRTLNLPYDLKFTDNWSKQFEAVRDLSGGKTGWWLPGVDRKADLSTDLIRLSDFETKELVRELANHAGVVYIRTPNGCAFEGNVDVTEFPDEYDNLLQTVSFSAEEVDPGLQFAGVKA